MMLRKLSTIIFILTLVFSRACFAQTVSPSQIQRTHDVLQKEEAWKEKINSPEKILIKDIEVKGITLLSGELVKNIISPYFNRWLSKDEIQGIMSSITESYHKNGFGNQPEEITYKIKKNSLKIQVNE